jgi:hypothetical protein
MRSNLRPATLGLLLAVGTQVVRAGATNPPPAVLIFHEALFATPPAPTPPAWIASVGREMGELVGGDRPAWRADASLPEGRGMVWIDLERELMNEDLALTLLHEEDANADLAVQLWDAQGRVVALDLFKNALAMSSEARTDTFILPLRHYPTATRIVLHRMAGGMRLYGAILTPVITPQDSDLETLLETARRFGNPISPEGDLMRRIEAARRAMPPAAAQASAQPSILRPAAEPAASGPPAPFTFAGLEWIGLRTEFAVNDGTIRPLPRARPGFDYGHWGHGRGATLLTGAGSDQWRDYTIDLDVGVSAPDPSFNPYRASTGEFSAIIGVRVVSWPENWNEDGMSACHFGIKSDGAWGVSINRGVFCNQKIGYGNLTFVEGRQIAKGAGLQLGGDRGNHVRIEVRGDRVRGWVDDRALFDLTDPALGREGEGVRLDHGGALVHWVWESQGWLSNFKATPLTAE